MELLNDIRRTHEITETQTRQPQFRHGAHNQQIIVLAQTADKTGIGKRFIGLINNHQTICGFYDFPNRGFGK